MTGEYNCGLTNLRTDESLQDTLIQDVHKYAFKTAIESDNGQTLGKAFNCSTKTIQSHLYQFDKRYKVGRWITELTVSESDTSKMPMFFCCLIKRRIRFWTECWPAMRSGSFTIFHGTIVNGWHYMNLLPNNKNYYCINRMLCSVFELFGLSCIANCCHLAR